MTPSVTINKPLKKQTTHIAMVTSYGNNNITDLIHLGGGGVMQYTHEK